MSTLQGLREFGPEIAKLQEQLLDAISRAMAVHAEKSTLLDRNRELEQECVRLQDWHAERQRYERREIGTGVFAYLPKEGVTSTQSAHKYCCHCFDNTKRSTLQQTREPLRTIGLQCPAGCPKLVFTHYLDTV